MRKNNSLIKFDLGDGLVGTGHIKGIAATPQHTIGVAYIVELVETLPDWSYDSVVVFESQIKDEVVVKARISRKLPKNKEHAQAQISNDVYAASGLYETLEYAGRVRGNGHHIRQQLAKYASDLMGERWEDDEKYYRELD